MEIYIPEEILFSESEWITSQFQDMPSQILRSSLCL